MENLSRAKEEPLLCGCLVHQLAQPPGGRPSAMPAEAQLGKPCDDVRRVFLFFWLVGAF